MRTIFVIVVAVLTQAIIPAVVAGVGTNAFDPGVPLSASETNAIRAGASNRLAAFKAFITPANHQLLGFNSVAEAALATNGEPMLVFVMRKNGLTNYSAGADVSLFFTPPPGLQSNLSAFIPVMVGTNVRSAILLRRTAGAATGAGATGTWGGTDWGQAAVIRNLVATWRAIPDGDLAPNTIRFVVEVPVPRIWLIGYYDTQQQLVLRSTVNVRVGTTTIHRHEALSQLQMEQLAAEARRFKPTLPN